jgi:hypothetical protein
MECRLSVKAREFEVAEGTTSTAPFGAGQRPSEHIDCFLDKCL